MTNHHSEAVGSMLRPDALIAARGQMRAGNLDPALFAEIEDAAVDEAIEIQEAAGLDVITDGEMRRDIFFDFFVSGATGLSPGLAQTVEFRAAHGNDEEFSVAVPFVVTERLQALDCPALKEFEYASTRATKPLKATLPSPGLVFAFWNPELTRDAYEDPFDLLRDATAVVEKWMVQLAAAGCEYIQIDAPEIAEVFADEVVQEEYRGRGIDPDTMKEVGVELIGQLGDVDLPGVTKELHVCKGNGTQAFIASGGYDDYAEGMFRRATGYDVFHLEYDDERSGSFDPLAKLGDDKLAVLGLVSTKWTKLEDPDELRGRIDDAARFHPKENLGLATQCGFASAAETASDRKITSETQVSKLELVADVARSVWG